MLDAPGAVVASSGGYHHHVTMTTWNSRGAGRRPLALGLVKVRILVDDLAAVERAAARLRGRRIDVDDDGRGIAVLDPWGTRMRLSPTNEG